MFYVAIKIIGFVFKLRKLRLILMQTAGNPPGETNAFRAFTSGIYNRISSISLFSGKSSVPNSYCDKMSEACEARLLKHGGIDPFPSESADNYYVKVNDDSYIYTMVLDKNGISDIARDENKVLNPEQTGEKTDRHPILICHGFGTGVGFFFKNLLPLSTMTERRVYALDWIGMGRSSRPLFPWVKRSSDKDTEDAIDYFVESVEAWRKQHKQHEKVVLVGHSLGGYLATWYALKYPENIEKLILLSPVGLPEPAKVTRDEKGEVSTVTGRKIPGWVTHLWDNNYTPQWLVRTAGPFGSKLVNMYASRRFYFLPPEEAKDISDYLYYISSNRGSGEYALGSILSPGAWARIPLMPVFGKLKVPTYFIYGDSDWMDYKHALKAKDLIKDENAHVYLVSNAGHHLYLDNPVEFNEVLASIVNDKHEEIQSMCGDNLSRDSKEDTVFYSEEEIDKPK
jgi:cardiolipin-specific phospholipase